MNHRAATDTHQKKGRSSASLAMVPIRITALMVMLPVEVHLKSVSTKLCKGRSFVDGSSARGPVSEQRLCDHSHDGELTEARTEGNGAEWGTHQDNDPPLCHTVHPEHNGKKRDFPKSTSSKYAAMNEPTC